MRACRLGVPFGHARGGADSVECADAAEQEARENGVGVGVGVGVDACCAFAFAFAAAAVYGAYGGGSLQSGEAAHRGIGVFFIGQRRAARERTAARKRARCGIGRRRGRERERERGRGEGRREGERERERGQERGRERGRDRERERAGERGQERGRAGDELRRTTTTCMWRENAE